MIYYYYYDIFSYEEWNYSDCQSAITNYDGIFQHFSFIYFYIKKLVWFHNFEDYLMTETDPIG